MSDRTAPVPVTNSTAAAAAALQPSNNASNTQDAQPDTAVLKPDISVAPDASTALQAIGKGGKLSQLKEQELESLTEHVEGTSSRDVLGCC